MTAATTPATDSEVTNKATAWDACSAAYDRGYAAGREKAIRECAAQIDIDFYHPELAKSLRAAILALLPTPPALSQEERT